MSSNKARADRANVVDISKAAGATNDGMVNLVARLGLGASPIQTSARYVESGLTRDRFRLENMYRGSWTTGVLVDSIAKDMTRSGVEILGKTKPEEIRKIQKSLTKNKVWTKLRDGIKWGRLFGGAISVILIDGQATASPLEVERIGKNQFRGLRVFDRWSLQPDLQNLIPIGPDAGMPMFYDIVADVNAGTLSGVRVHHSRVVRHIGIELPFLQALKEQLWGASVVERSEDRVVAFDTATAGMAQLVHKAHLRTVSIEGLRAIFQAGGKAEENLVTMFRYMAMLQSTEGITLLDSKDQFAVTNYTFTGLVDIILNLAQQLCGDSGIPMVKFFGQSPTGMNATGESDVRNYYDTILSNQESDLRDGIERILLVAHQSELGRLPGDDFEFDFVPLWQMSTKEKVEVAKTGTETVKSAFDAGIIDRAAALLELRQLSDTTGIFTNISDEDIEDAENEPPLSEQNELDREAAAEAQAAAKEEAAKKKGAIDWLRRRLRRGGR